VATGGQPNEAAHEDELRRQDVELYQGLTVLLADMPAGTTLDEALRSPKGHRVRRKWELKYGRDAPLQA
jgi:hypothetical protein